jgi:hypothetical protein
MRDCDSCDLVCPCRTKRAVPHYGANFSYWDRLGIQRDVVIMLKAADDYAAGVELRGLLMEGRHSPRTDECGSVQLLRIDESPYHVTVINPTFAINGAVWGWD